MTEIKRSLAEIHDLSFESIYESVYDENSNFQPEKLKLNDHQNAISSYSYGMTYFLT